MRIFVANFDAELEMARAATPGPHPPLPAHVRARLLAARDAFGVLGADEIVSNCGELPDAAEIEVLPWAETESVSRPVAAAARGTAARAIGVGGWLDDLWRLRSDPIVVRRCHDRRFWLALAEARKTTLPETHAIDSMTSLRAHLPAVARQSAEGAWIAKAPFSAAGRERVYRWGTDIPADATTRLERLFSRYGELILEPLMPRLADVGVSGIIDEAGARLFAPHGLRCDDAGVFRAIEATPQLTAAQLEPIREAAAAAGDALLAAGHRGAFGIDAFVYKTVAAGAAVHPMCEINVRLTFGHLFHARNLAAPR